MHDLPLLTTIAAALAAAWVLGLLTQRLRLSPIVGYLLAGVIVGPYTPGFIADEDIAHQLAEIGVILMMFGVGLHFHPKDLLAVKNVAIPGAVVQSAVATVLAVVAFHYLFDWPFRSGIVIGMAMAVASTVVLLRVLTDREMVATTHGHVAVGWLIVEDIFTVLALVVVPMLGAREVAEAVTGAGGHETVAAAAGHIIDVVAPVDGEAAEGQSIALRIAWAVGKLAAMVVIVFLAGSRIVPWILERVAKLRSRELFTLTVLVLSIAIAVGSAVVFGASVALGAFLAGMVVAQSPASHQAGAELLPMRDAFAVLFFTAVGMLFDPSFLVEEPVMVAVALGIVLIAKPAAALFIVIVLGYPVRTALTVALALAQIGEFSFILAQVGREYGVLPDTGHYALVATAMISITINPLIFGLLDPIENALRKRPALWKLLNGRADRRSTELNADAARLIATETRPLAVIVGYGPVGRVVDALLRDAGIETIIVEMNMHTVQSLLRAGRRTIYGDATRADILEQAGVPKAAHLVITLPQSVGRGDLIAAARQLNPTIEITVRTRYIGEKEALHLAGVNKAVFEEGEAGLALARHVLEQRGVERHTIDTLLDSLRKVWGIADGTP